MERARLNTPEQREARDNALTTARKKMQAAENHAAKLEAARRDLKIAELENEAAEAAATELDALEKALANADRIVSVTGEDLRRAPNDRNECIEEEETAAKNARAV